MKFKALRALTKSAQTLIHIESRLTDMPDDIKAEVAETQMMIEDAMKDMLPKDAISVTMEKLTQQKDLK